MFEIIRSLIVAAAVAHGVNAEAMIRVGVRESGLSASVVNGGGCIGVFQLCPWGELNGFYRRGYTNPRDPSQQANYVAERFRQGACAQAWRATCPVFALTRY